MAKHIKAQNRKRLDWCQLVVPVITPQSEEDMLAEIKAIEDKIREQICKDFVPLRRKELVEGRDIQPGHFRPQRPRAEPRAPQGDSASKERASTSRPVPEARHPLLTSKPVPIKSTPASTSPRLASVEQA